jgi:hypothetical protein
MNIIICLESAARVDREPTIQEKELLDLVVKTTCNRKIFEPQEVYGLIYEKSDIEDPGNFCCRIHAQMLDIRVFSDKKDDVEGTFAKMQRAVEQWSARWINAERKTV